MKLKQLIVSAAAAAACLMGGAAQAVAVPSFTFSHADSYDWSVAKTPGATGTQNYYLELINALGHDATATVTLQFATPSSPSQSVAYAVYADQSPTATTAGQVTLGGPSVPVSPTGFVTDISNSDVTPFFTFLMQQGTQYVLQLTTGASTNLVSTNISAVPLPGAMWLFGSALLGFLGFSNRRKI